MLVPDAQVDAARVQEDFATVIDLTKYYCDDTTCWPAAGNVSVYRDDNHVTQTWMATLGPKMTKEFRRAAARIG